MWRWLGVMGLCFVGCVASKTPTVAGGSGTSSGGGDPSSLASQTTSGAVSGVPSGSTLGSSTVLPTSGTSLDTPSSAVSTWTSSQGAPLSGASAATSTGGPLPGDTCQTAETLTGTELINGLTTAGYTKNYDASTSPSCWGSDSAERVHRVEVAPGQRLDVEVIPAPGFDVAANLIMGPASNCDAADYQCVDWQDEGSAGDTEHLSWINPAATPQTVFIVVLGFNGASGNYSLRVHQVTPPAGDGCSNAAPLAAGLLSGQTTVGMSSQFQKDTTGHDACVGHSAPDRIYRVEVPAGQRLTVTATPENNFDVALDLLVGDAAACASPHRGCVAGSDREATGRPETVTYSNNTAVTQNVFVVVDGGINYTSGAFALNVVMQAPPPGDRCDLAVELTLGSVMDTTVGLGSDLVPHNSCTGNTNATGADKVYSMVVPAGKKLSVAVQSLDAAFDPTLYILMGPAAQCTVNPLVCLTGSDVAGLAENVTYVNPGAAPQPVFVVVDSTHDTAGAYSINATLGDP